MNRPEDSEVVRSARHLLSLLTSGSTAGPSQENARQHPVQQHPVQQHPVQQRATIQTEMTRSFPGFFNKGRGKRRITSITTSKPAKILPVNIYLLPRLFDRTPKESEQLIHMQAGLGRKTMHLEENATYEEICAQLKEMYPKFQEIRGVGFSKSSGGWGSRKLTLIPPDESGYNAKNLKTATNGFKGVIYIAPLQMELNTSALPPESESFNEMPKEKCQRCGVSYPLLILTTHINTCATNEDAEQTGDEAEQTNDADQTNDDADQTSDEAEQTKQATCPICQKEMSLDVIEIHASFCMGDREEPSTSGFSVPLTYTAEASNAAKATSMSHDWKIEPDKNKAASLYTKEIIRQHETGKSLLMAMDVRMDKEDQDRELVAFYKQNGIEWACPVRCKLQGDAAIGEGVTRHFFSTVIQRLQHGFNFNMGNTARTCLFEGEPGHLVPSSSQFLIESDLFLVAGRMIGHAFLHGGPRLAGVSQAIVHVLLGGSAETATVQIEDCPDHDIRETIKLLDGEAELSSEEYQAVLHLSLAWDLPGPTKENRKWLFERLLSHAVIGRRLRQLKQIRKGLKETRVWPLLIERKDVEIFLRENENSLTPSMLLQCICWPSYISENDDDNDDEDCSLEDRRRISWYLRHFIETASSSDLKNLVKFWLGWEVPEGNMVVEVVNSKMPKSSTCFNVLRLPAHYMDYSNFKDDLLMCIGTSEYGFGLV
nr:uncharacterized protein LOC129441422 [Misgurnus anguillicaudatus]